MISEGSCDTEDWRNDADNWKLFKIVVFSFLGGVGTFWLIEVKCKEMEIIYMGLSVKAQLKSIFFCDLLFST